MIALKHPHLIGDLGLLVHSHRQVACGQVVRVTVWSVNPEEQDKVIHFQMYACPCFTDRLAGGGTITTIIRGREWL